MSGFIDFLKGLGEEYTQEIADVISVESIPDFAAMPMSFLKIALPPAMILDQLTNDGLDRFERRVEGGASDVLDKIPGLKTANWVTQRVTPPAWADAERKGDFGSFKNALDSTGNEFWGATKYLANALTELPEFMLKYPYGIAQGFAGITQAVVNNGDVKSEVGNLAKAVYEPWLKIVSEPIEDVHEYQGKAAYDFLITGEWNAGGLFPFNLPGEVVNNNPEEHQAIIDAYERGHDSNGDGTPDFYGGRAVWEYVIGRENRMARVFFEVVNDPWTATILLSWAKLGLQGLAKGSGKLFANPKTAETLMKIARAVGFVEKGANSIPDAPLLLAKGGKRLLGKAAPTTMGRFDAAVDSTVQGAKNLGKRATFGVVDRALGLTDEYIAEQEANAAATALDKLKETGTLSPAAAVLAKHQPQKQAKPTNVIGFINQHHAKNPTQPTGMYEAIGDRDIPYYIVDPSGNVVPEFAGYVGAGKKKAAESARDALNRYRENYGDWVSPLVATSPSTTPAGTTPFPTAAPAGTTPFPPINPAGTTPSGTTPPSTVSLGPPPPKGPLVEDSPDAVIADDLPKDAGYTPPAVNDVNSPTNPAVGGGDNQDPDWWEFKPRIINGEVDPSDNRALSNAVRAWKSASTKDKRKKYVNLFKAIGYDPNTNAPIPGGVIDEYEKRRRAIAQQFYGASPNGEAIEVAAARGGGFDRKVMNEYIASLQHAMLELTPIWNKYLGGNPWPFDYYNMPGVVVGGAQKPISTFTVQDVYEWGKRLYQPGWGDGGLPGQSMRDRANVIRTLINVAVFREDEVGMAAMRVLGRHGWPNGKSGSFITNYVFKHMPEKLLGFSGGKTAAIYRSKAVREVEEQFRDDLSPMDWIGTLRKFFYGRDPLESTPYPARVNIPADPNISPAVGTAAPQSELDRIRAELSATTSNTRLQQDQVNPLTRLAGNLARATGVGDEGLRNLQFTSTDAPSTMVDPTTLNQADEAIPEVAPNPIDNYDTPSAQRTMITDAMSSSIFYGSPLNKYPELKEDIVKAIIDDDAAAIDAIVRNSRMSPADRWATKNLLTKANQRMKNVVIRNESVRRVQEELPDFLPNVKTLDDVRALAEQPTPQDLVRADYSVASEKYPDLDPEEAYQRLVADGEDRFSRRSPLVDYVATYYQGNKKVKRTLLIPGGLKDGTFSYWDLSILQAQGFDPAIMKKRDAADLYAKVFRSMDRKGVYDPIDMWTRLAFGVMSSSALLDNNMRMVAVLRPRTREELREMAEFVREFGHTSVAGGRKPEPGRIQNPKFPNDPKKTIARERNPELGEGMELNVLAREWARRMVNRRKATGELSPDASFEMVWKEVKDGVIDDNIARALLIGEAIDYDMMLVETGKLPRPFFSQQKELGEGTIDYVNRVGAVLEGLASKTTNFGMMLGDPGNWPHGTMDIHMMKGLKRWIIIRGEEIKDAGMMARVPSRFIDSNGNLTVPEDFASAFSMKEVAIDESGKKPYARMDIKNADGTPVNTTTKIGARERAIAEHGAPESILYGREFFPVSGKPEPNHPDGPGFSIIKSGDEYSDAMELLQIFKDLDAVDNPAINEMSLGGYQWYVWDQIRGRFEAHFMAFPGMRHLERLDLEEWRKLKKAAKAHEPLDDWWAEQYPVDMAPKRAMEGKKLTEEALPVVDEQSINEAKALRGTITQYNPAKVMRQELEKAAGTIKGQVEIQNPRALIRLFETGDVSTVVHELAHVTRMWLDEIDLEVANRFVGATDGNWTVEQEEKFARGFERFMRNPELAKNLDQETLSMFDQLARWMRQIYDRIVGDMRVRVTPEMSEMFSRLSSGQTREEWAARTDLPRTFKGVGSEGKPTPPASAAPTPTSAAASPTPDPAAAAPTGQLGIPGMETASPAAAKKVRPASEAKTTKTPTANSAGSKALGSAPAPKVEDSADLIIPETKKPSPKKRVAAAPPQQIAAVGRRLDEDVDIKNLDTWTPALFAAVHRILNKEEFSSLEPLLQDALVDARIFYKGKVRSDALKTAKATIDFSDPYSYEVLANFARTKPIYAKNNLFQMSIEEPTKILTQQQQRNVQFSNPTRTGDLVLDFSRKIGDLDDADIAALTAYMPDVINGAPPVRVIDVYRDAIADGMTPRQATQLVANRMGKFYRMSAKEKDALLSGRSMPRPGAIRRAINKLGTFNMIAKQNQMYNMTKVLTRPLSDYIGNTIHMAITGNWNATSKQVKAIPELVKILFVDPKQAQQYATKASDSFLDGIDTSLPTIITSDYGGTVNKFGFTGDDLILQQIAKDNNLPWGARVLVSTLANERVRAMSEAMDMMSRKNLGLASMQDAHLNSLFELRKRLTDDGLDATKVLNDALARARKRTGDPNVSSFSSRDLLSAAGSDHARWWGEQRGIWQDRALEDARKVLFVGSKQRNIEKTFGWIMYYFYWQSRSMGLAAKAAYENPWVLSSYVKMWEGAQNEAERNGYPSTFTGLISYWGDPTNSIGWFGMSNPLGVLVPGFMMSEYYDATRKDDNEDAFYERLNTLIPASVIFNSAMAALGHTDQVPDMIGSRQVENVVLAVMDWGKANGFDLSNGQPTESVIESVERALIEGANAFARASGIAEGQYDPYVPASGKKDVIKSVIWQYAVEDFGDDIEDWTPEQWEKVSVAMTVVDEGAGSSDLAQRAFREWANQSVKNRFLNTVTPGGSVLRYNPRQQASRRNRMNDPRLLPADNSPRYQDAQANDKANRQASLQRDIVTGEKSTRDLLIQQQMADSASTPDQRAAEDYYNLLVYRVETDTEAYPDTMTFPTAIGPVTARALRNMTEEERINLANRFLTMTGASYDKDLFYLNTDMATESGKLPELKAYSDYKSLIGQFETVSEFRQWARDNNPFFAQQEEAARKRFMDKDNLEGAALEERLDGWAKSTRAYQSFRGRRFSMYDNQPVNGRDMGASMGLGSMPSPPTRTDRIENEVANLASDTSASANLALMGAGYRGQSASSEASRYSSWLQENQGSANEWWREESGIPQMPEYFNQ